MNKKEKKFQESLIFQEEYAKWKEMTSQEVTNEMLENMKKEFEKTEEIL